MRPPLWYSAVRRRVSEPARLCRSIWGRAETVRSFDRESGFPTSRATTRATWWWFAAGAGRSRGGGGGRSKRRLTTQWPLRPR